MWLGGGMLYLWIISLIFYRYTFFTLSPSDLAPPYWINMGAAAISTLAGDDARRWPRPHRRSARRLLPVRARTTLHVVGDGDLVDPDAASILGVWRHVYRRFPLRYDPLYWGAVFPLGMYTVAHRASRRAVDAPYLVRDPARSPFRRARRLAAGVRWAVARVLTRARR